MTRRPLWQGPADPLAREIAALVGVTAVVPLALVVLFGPPGGPAEALTLYAQAFVVTACVTAAIRLGYAIGGRLLTRAMTAPARLGTHVAIVLIGAAAGSELASLLLAALWGGAPASYRSGLLRVSLVVSTCVVVGLTAWDHWRARIHRAQLRELEARAAQAEAELQLLRSRTRPHFLFNSLNTVAGLIHEAPDQAEEVLERMSSLFRYALAASEHSRVPLSDEIEAATDYLRVQQIRFGDRVRFEIDHDPALDDVLVLSMVLQPLVENAVLHGIGERETGGLVRVRTACVDGVLALSVEDDGVGPGHSTHTTGAGTALAVLRKSLELTYPGSASVVEDQPPTGGYRVALRIPEERP